MFRPIDGIMNSERDIAAGEELLNDGFSEETIEDDDEDDDYEMEGEPSDFGFDDDYKSE